MQAAQGLPAVPLSMSCATESINCKVLWVFRIPKAQAVQILKDKGHQFQQALHPHLPVVHHSANSSFSTSSALISRMPSGSARPVMVSPVSESAASVIFQ